MANMIQKEIVVDKYSVTMLGLKEEGSEVWINFNKSLDKDFRLKADEFINKVKQGDLVELTINEDTGYWHKGKRIRKTKTEEPRPEEIISETKPEPKQYTDKPAVAADTPEPTNQFTDKTSYFFKLNHVEGNVVKKGIANYISWADAWNELKKIYPKSSYKVYEDMDGFPYISNDEGAFVKVGVTVEGIENVSFLPVMDNKFNSMKKVTYTVKKWNKTKKQMVDEEVQAYTMFDINRSIQRAFAKAIAMHGMGLYVYRGEDIPDKEE